jgi:hypothetical protein
MCYCEVIDQAGLTSGVVHGRRVHQHRDDESVDDPVSLVHQRDHAVAGELALEVRKLFVTRVGRFAPEAGLVLLVLEPFLLGEVDHARGVDWFGLADHVSRSPQVVGSHSVVPAGLKVGCVWVQ